MYAISLSSTTELNIRIMKRRFLFLLAVLQQVSSLENNFNGSNNMTAVIESLYKLALISKVLKVSIWYSEDQRDFISESLKKFEFPILLNAEERSTKEGLEKRWSTDIVIILYETNVEHILNNTLWNARTRFIILADDLNQVRNNFALFWNHKVINAFAMIQEEDGITFYGFFPYSKGQCGTGKIVTVDKYKKNTGNFENGGSAINDKVKIKKMNQCPVNITIVDVKPMTIFTDETGSNTSTRLGGIEGNLMEEVARRLDFNATFRIALDGIGWGWIRPAPRGAVGEVYTGKSDFANGLLAPTVERYENLDLSVPYSEHECITYGVPNGAGVSTPSWITILVFEFTPLTWTLIFFSFIFVFYVFYGMDKYSKINWFKRKSDIFLYEFSSLLGLPIQIPDYLFTRLTVLTWILFAFVTTLAYKSSISSKLTVPSEDPDIDKFDELLDSNLQLTGYNNMLRLLQYNESEPIINRMVERFKVTEFDINYAINLIAEERKIAYMRHTSTFLYYSLIHPRFKGQIHVMADCVLTYYPVIATKKNSPFSYRLNQLISRLMESGITQKWRSKYIYHIPPASKPFHKLSIYHMYGVFCILGGGCLLGTLVLLYEITSHCCGSLRRSFKKK